jgi:hypothetical protein
MIHSAPPPSKQRKKQVIQKILIHPSVQVKSNTLIVPWQEQKNAKHNGEFESWKSVIFRAYAQYLILSQNGHTVDDYHLEALEPHIFLQELLFPFVENYALSKVTPENKKLEMFTSFKKRCPYFKDKDISRRIRSYLGDESEKSPEKAKTSKRAFNTLA